MRFNPNWSSHLPILVKVLNASSGPVLEMGTGIFSTPIMHWLCLDAGRLLISYENNKSYYDQSKSFETDNHKLILIKNWDEAEVESIHWGAVLIDHEPAERRSTDIKRLAGSADYIIVHDSEEEEDDKYHLSEIYSLFKFRYDWRKQKPYTTVLSNFKDLSNL